ncbi:hypothetical protein Taro_028289 [Colocasia esculenta]|uniref:aldehyde oxygenase (deformylating) n=1 Tax=Colocasia esculenta TaxID=4460 RepID=A0A843VRD1_COLES|nr:hypothetical protein [Colocasia esculenta]
MELPPVNIKAGPRGSFPGRAPAAKRGGSYRKRRQSSMASRPGILTQWPWQKLGSFKVLFLPSVLQTHTYADRTFTCLLISISVFAAVVVGGEKYVVLAPFVAQGLHGLASKGWEGADLTNLSIFPFLLLRALHNQLWISFSRFQTARSKHIIVRKPLEFEQVDRERNWDDQIILTGLLFYLGNTFLHGASHNHIWRADGVAVMALTHAGPVELLYYWLHRALHHHFLYSRYHSHHHASVVTEPITSVIHPFAEHLAYFALFSIPILTALFTGTISILAVAIYILYIDFMNNLGHCNFEVIPKRLFDVLPFLKYLMYTPSFHSLHHTQFRTNYSLFMPFYDFIYGTMDKSSDALYESSLEGKEEAPHLVYLTHPTTTQSIYQMRLGLASIASKPCTSKWYMLLMWPFTYTSMLLMWIYGTTFVLERNSLKQLKMQTWAIPRFHFQYRFAWEQRTINGMIEKAILDAEERGVKVSEELNQNGELYIRKYPKLKTRIVDGSSLAVAVALQSIPSDASQVLIRGGPSKMAFALAHALCKRNVQIWLVGDGLTDEEQRKATKDTHIIPFSQFPPRRQRKDCVYHTTPAMTIPMSLVNVHSCENWLPRRAMSAWRVAGILHALEGWDQHECGDTMFDTGTIWSSALSHGFLPLVSL